MVLRFTYLHLIMLLSTFFASAQQFKERVYLKDSITFYEGYIIEQAPSKYVKIYRLVEKDTLTVLLNDVLKLTKVYTIDSVKKNIKSIKQNIQSTYTKVAFAEILGNAIIYSLNYDMRTAKGVRDKWGFRIGIEHVGLSATDSITTKNTWVKVTAIPFGLNYLIGKRKGFLELGLGATYFHLKGKDFVIDNLDKYSDDILYYNNGFMIGTFNIGYRHVPINNGIMYRCTFSPLLLGSAFIPFVGFGVGYHFK